MEERIKLEDILKNSRDVYREKVVEYLTNAVILDKISNQDCTIMLEIPCNLKDYIQTIYNCLSSYEADDILTYFLTTLETRHKLDMFTYKDFKQFLILSSSHRVISRLVKRMTDEEIKDYCQSLIEYLKQLKDRHGVGIKIRKFVSILLGLMDRDISKFADLLNEIFKLSVGDDKDKIDMYFVFDALKSNPETISLQEFCDLFIYFFSPYQLLQVIFNPHISQYYIFNENERKFSLKKKIVIEKLDVVSYYRIASDTKYYYNIFDTEYIKEKFYKTRSLNDKKILLKSLNCPEDILAYSISYKNEQVKEILKNHPALPATLKLKFSVE